MTDQLRKVKQYQKILNERRWENVREVENLMTAPSGYKKDNTPPAPSEFVPFSRGEFWGSGNDTHAWFHCTVNSNTPNTYLRVQTEKTGWDAGNPQFIAYINGKMRQGLDTNHLEVLLGDVGSADVYLYGYTGPTIDRVQLFVKLLDLNPDVDGLYYDIQYPLEMLGYLDAESGEYANILEYLYRAVSMLNLLDQDRFVASVKEAREYLSTEFYQGYCTKQKSTTVCIGHTHIDCAWLWTLAQTREKVQRSFSTVLELMERYPEYKFMSSQALLYENLKEEAPEQYERVKERIQEGRWECEGAMWVEADCNLSSGESLVRQVLYGKDFFRKEFGVENRVLWLPDVFGYSAALPQILKKSGVDWFVTSKISWNDTNQMPCDTFKWKGIDGTEINSYFLTAQKDTGGPTVKYTTYVGKTNAQMISGTYKRYRQKNLNNEALLTFGFGDGGGGPTSEHLELVRRGAHGIPGSPNTTIEFAGDFLRRLEDKIKDEKNLPRWQGELYLEFHRGTYTTLAKNKKNNRKSEFLFLNAEAMSVMEKALFGKTETADELHRGWKLILTNQFHDIIPGSSIHEVYDQSDIDYAEAFSIGNGIVDHVRNQIASKLAKEKGYAVFNPHSFASNGMINLNGTTVLTEEKVPSKGYLLTNRFVKDNHIQVNGRIVVTDRYSVTFDEHWQITSLYDREQEREVLTTGEVGNELRVYADYPDSYDAWEWQIYSRDEYETLTDVESAEWIQDGIRTGLRIVRPYQKSKVTQTVWFYDEIGKIDFETTVDWHQQHQMLKVAFPVEINSDEATYEIQFGNIKRPAHFNTTWNQAQFESCAHKYADLSDGNYGVSIINDCKYGHDIHEGVISLSLLRSPTYPDPEADQGENSFTYSICPHAGRLNESDTVELAYLLNEPMTIAKATGETSTLPEKYSLLSIDRENVICETVKEAEDGKGTIIRCYEAKNIRGKATVQLGIPAKKVFLCDLQERKLEEIPVEKGCFAYEFKGFEIATFLVEG